MKALYALNPIGVFAYSEDGKLLASALFPADAAQIARGSGEWMPS